MHDAAQPQVVHPEFCRIALLRDLKQALTCDSQMHMWSGQGALIRLMQGYVSLCLKYSWRC